IAAARIASLLTEPAPTQSEPDSACSMAIFRIVDPTGNPIPDFDLLLTAGPEYSPDHLPHGFFIDRQRNRRAPNVLTYYLDHAAMSQTRQLGFRLQPRPSSGPVHFDPAEYRGENL